MLLIKTWWWILSLRDHKQRSRSWSDPLWREIQNLNRFSSFLKQIVLGNIYVSLLIQSHVVFIPGTLEQNLKAIDPLFYVDVIMIFNLYRKVFQDNIISRIFRWIDSDDKYVWNIYETQQVPLSKYINIDDMPWSKCLQVLSGSH